MKIQKVKLLNFGPVKQGEFELRDINIFYGPNNSGKSMTARLLYGISRPPRRYGLDFDSDAAVMPTYVRRYLEFRRVGVEERLAHNAMRMVTDRLPEIVSFKKRICRCEFETPFGRLALSLTITRSGTSRLSTKGENVLSKIYSAIARTRGRPAVYVPAARTGTIQFFNSMIYMRNQLLRSIIRSFGGAISRQMSTTEIRRFLLSLGKFPLYLEDFYDLLLEFFAKGEVSVFERSIKALHGGTVRLRTRRELPSLVYVDISGFESEIESAGSGVVASFPIVLGMTRIAPGGILVVEEPELHLEPNRQMALVALLCEQAIRRKFTLVLTTHSDFIIKKTLGLIRRRKIRNSNVGLQFFDRKAGQLTTIRSLDISDEGEAEQPLFDEAVQALVKDYSDVVSTR